MKHIYRAAAVLGLGLLLLAADRAPETNLAFLFPNDGDDTSIGTVSTQDTAFATQPIPEFIEEPIIFPEPELAPVLPEADNLAAMVKAMRSMPALDVDRDLECLATAVYFESKGEPLEGQLAVAQVILNRVEQGRYGDDICDVVTAPRQFSFVRGGRLPAPRGMQQWEVARAIAIIAAAEGWQDVVGEATHFHAVYVNPRWRLKRVAQIGNHIFYR